MDTELSLILANFAGEEAQAVSARDLFNFLELNKGQYSRWINKVILGNGEEGKDFILNNDLKVESREEYILTIDFAKSVSMMSNSKKGKEVRQYFLNIEKAYKAKVQKPLTQLEIIVQSAQILQNHDDRIRLLESKAMTSNVEFFAVSGYAHNIGRRITGLEAQSFGKKAMALSKKLGYKTGSVPDAKWGHVGTYHTDILAEIMK